MGYNEHNYLVIGETCKDVFIYGHVLRLSPEAPIPIFTPVNTVTSFGMADNVERNLKHIAEREGRSILVNRDFPFGYATKTRYVDEKSNHYFLRVDTAEHTYEPYAFDESKKDFYLNADMVIISDYNKGFLKPKDYVTIRENASQSIIVADTKKILCREIMDSVDFVKMNMTEFDKNYEALGGDFIEEYENKIVITNGGNGAEYMYNFYPTENVNTIDVSGAGDTFLAAFAFKYNQTYSVDTSIRFANEMANIVVKKRGVSTVL